MVFFYHRRGTRPADEEGHTLTEGESELSPVSSSWKETLEHLPTSTPAARMLPDLRDQGPPRGAGFQQGFSSPTRPASPHTQSKRKTNQNRLSKRQVSGSRSYGKVPGPWLGSMTGDYHSSLA